MPNELFAAKADDGSFIHTTEKWRYDEFVKEHGLDKPKPAPKKKAKKPDSEDN